MLNEKPRRVVNRLNSSAMSYKFQRLREEIRHAVASGELSGKLPGERELARRFQVNAKTLSKALTDLAAEGLLQRNIGKGTFVRQEGGVSPTSKNRWIVLTDVTSDPCLLEHLRGLNPTLEQCEDIAAIRPSVLNQFSGIVDLAAATPDGFIRDLLVRGLPIVSVGQKRRLYSVDRVVPDTTLGAAQLTRQLILGGHRHFAVIEERGRIEVADAIRQTAERYCDDCQVDAMGAWDIALAAEYGVTACICDSEKQALRILETLERSQIAVPQKMSVATVGSTGSDHPCTGYYFDARQEAAAIADLLARTHSRQPTTLWLTGVMVDRGTTAPLRITAAAAQSEGLPLQMLAAPAPALSLPRPGTSSIR